MNGILPLYKPKGYTSHDCVMIVRKLFKTKKVGHTGTLDPDVEGVLPICIGEATKIIPFLITLHKEYVADVYLGKSTTTEDASGETVAEKPLTEKPTASEINDVLEQFQGDITQMPPMYSAVKVNGKKLYEYARANIEVERPERNITIHQIEHVDRSETANHIFRIRVNCSKGTYIRTLCVDIGKALGYPAHMSYLQRVESDTITLADTVTFSEIEEALAMEKGASLLKPISHVLKHLSVFQVDELMKKRVLQGQKFARPETDLKTNPFAMIYEDELLAIYEIHPEKADEIKPVRVFNLYK